MLPNTRWLKRAVFWPVLGIPLGMFLAFAVTLGNGVGSSAGVEVLDGPRIAYLPNTARPTLTLEEARGRGLRVAGSADDLRWAAASADALIIDSGQLHAVAMGDWLKGQRTQGRIIVALNTPMDALVRAAGSPFDHVGSFRADWYGARFYSYVFQSSPGRSPGYQGQGSDTFHSIDALLHAVRLRYQQVSGTVRPPGSPRPMPPA